MLVLLLPAAAAAQESDPATSGVPAVAAQAAAVDTTAAPIPADSTAPSPLTIAADYDGTRWLTLSESWSVTLSRSVEPADGRIAVFVGHTDVTALTTRQGTRLTYRPAGVRLPPGESEVVVYLSDADAWRELGRLPIRLLTAGGFERAAMVPKVDLVSDGQIDQGGSPDTGADDRGLYQDVTANVGFDGTVARRGWTVKSRANAVGVSQDEQRLRFAAAGPRCARGGPLGLPRGARPGPGRTSAGPHQLRRQPPPAERLHQPRPHRGAQARARRHSSASPPSAALRPVGLEQPARPGPMPTIGSGRRRSAWSWCPRAPAPSTSTPR